MGNTTVVKPSKFGVLLHQPLLRAFAESFPPGVVNFIYGRGAEITPALMKSGNVDVLALIGSSRAADILKRDHPRPHRLRSILSLVERPHRKADPKRRTPDLRNHPAIQAEAGVRTIDFFQRLDGLVDVLQRAVKFLAAVVRFLPISHMSRFTTSRRTVNIFAANVSTAAMRAATLMVGHGPRPWSQARTAAFNPAMAASSFIEGT